MAGTPRECGRQYGAVARELIVANLNTYLDAFRAELGLTPDEVYAHAARYVPLIDAYDPDTLAEMRGLADGAEVPFEAVVASMPARNCSTPCERRTPMTAARPLRSCRPPPPVGTR